MSRVLIVIDMQKIIWIQQKEKNFREYIVSKAQMVGRLYRNWKWKAVST